MNTIRTLAAGTAVAGLGLALAGCSSNDLQDDLQDNRWDMVLQHESGTWAEPNECDIFEAEFSADSFDWEGECNTGAFQYEVDDEQVIIHFEEESVVYEVNAVEDEELRGYNFEQADGGDAVEFQIFTEK